MLKTACGEGISYLSTKEDYLTLRVEQTTRTQNNNAQRKNQHTN